MKISKLEHLLFTISDELTDDVEISKAYLLEQGVNPETIATNGINKLKQFQLNKQAAINQEKDKLLYELALIKIKEKASIFGNNLNDLISELTHKRPSFQFRNVESLTEGDLREILGEVELIDLMEKLDSKKQ